MTKKLLLFDFDGTVMDNSEGIYDSINYATDKMGLPRADGRTLRSFVGPPLYDSFRRHFQDDHEKANLFVELYRENFAPRGSKMAVLYETMEALLSALQRDGYTLAVCSSKPYEFVTEIADTLGVAPYFSGFFCPCRTDTDSDKSRYILAAAEHFGAEKRDILMIGDTRFDILAAKKSGVESLGVRYGFAKPGELEESGADFIAETVSDVYRIITGKCL